MNYSPIEWTNFTSNPLQYRDSDGNVVWGCIHASPGCMKCYSEALAKRYGRGGQFDVSTMEGLTPFINEKEIHSIMTYKPATGKMCFLGDMTDIFGEWVPVELIAQIFNAMAARPDVTFQILTKRAERMQHILNGPKHHGLWTPKMWHNEVLPNVWIGVSVENQQYADQRIPLLLQTPAAVRFISYEPALGPVDLRAYLGVWEVVQGDRVICSHEQRMTKSQAENKVHNEKRYGIRMESRRYAGSPRLDWLICGGESGSGARTMDPEWAVSVLDQCVTSEVPFFFKQWGGVQKKKAGRELDGREWNEFPH